MSEWASARMALSRWCLHLMLLLLSLSPLLCLPCEWHDASARYLCCVWLLCG